MKALSVKVSFIVGLVACAQPRILRYEKADTQAKVAAQAAVEKNVSAAAEPVLPAGVAQDAHVPVPATAAGVEIGAPVAVYFVRLDELCAFHDSQNAAALLHATGERFYPVLQAGRVTSSVSIALRADGAWHGETSGDVAIAQAVTALAAALPAVTAPSQGLVQIPALGVSFLVHDQNGATFLTPLDDVAGFTPGHATPLAEALALLSQFAKTTADEAFYD